MLSITLLGLCIGCNSNTKPGLESDVLVENNEIKFNIEQTYSISEEKEISDKLRNELALKFAEKLKNSSPLQQFMDKSWTFIYHEENRCTGATDGKKRNLNKKQVDTTIVLNVENNSEHAWACDKKEPYNYDLEIKLKKQIEKWDRFEVQSNEYELSNKKKEVFYILGKGESDYMEIHFGDNNLITLLKYNSEDPG